MEKSKIKEILLDIFQYVLIWPLYEFFQIIFIWFCFKLRLVSLSLEVNGETIHQVTEQIKTINRKAKVILVIAILVVLSFELVFFLNSWLLEYKTKGFEFAVKMVYQCYIMFQMYLFVDFSRMGYRYLRMLSEDGRLKIDRRSVSLTFVIVVCFSEQIVYSFWNWYVYIHYYLETDCDPLLRDLGSIQECILNILT